MLDLASRWLIYFFVFCFALIGVFAAGVVLAAVWQWFEEKYGRRRH